MLGHENIRCQKTTFNGFETEPYAENPYQEDIKIEGGDMLYVLPV